jgi:hypothetical protein
MGDFGHVVLKAYGAEPLTGFIPTGSVAEIWQKIRSHLHVLFCGEAAQKVVPLKNHSNAPAHLLASTSAGPMQGLTEHRHLTVLNRA